jgi:hypothetical protein
MVNPMRRSIILSPISLGIFSIFPVLISPISPALAATISFGYTLETYDPALESSSFLVSEVPLFSEGDLGDFQISYNYYINSVAPEVSLGQQVSLEQKAPNQSPGKSLSIESIISSLSQLKLFVEPSQNNSPVAPPKLSQVNASDIDQGVYAFDTEGNSGITNRTPLDYIIFQGQGLPTGPFQAITLAPSRNARVGSGGLAGLMLPRYGIGLNSPTARGLPVSSPVSPVFLAGVNPGLRNLSTGAIPIKYNSAVFATNPRLELPLSLSQYHDNIVQDTENLADYGTLNVKVNFPLMPQVNLMTVADLPDDSLYNSPVIRYNALLPTTVQEQFKQALDPYLKRRIENQKEYQDLLQLRSQQQLQFQKRQEQQFSQQLTRQTRSFQQQRQPNFQPNLTTPQTPGQQIPQTNLPSQVSTQLPSQIQPYANQQQFSPNLTPFR